MIENSKKIVKKLKKIKRYHYGFISSFWVGKVRERAKIKIIVPFRSVPIRCIMENSKKIAKKLKILKKNHYGIISSQNRLENAEKERK